MIHHRLRGLQKVSAAPSVADVFSVDLYTGNGSTQTITNGVNLSGEGGLVWIKSRSVGTAAHYWIDTIRGATDTLNSDNTDAAFTASTGLTAFSSTGFSIGSNGNINANSSTNVAWTFRQAPRFFDVVTYTGSSSTVDPQVISHALGVTPGMIVLRKADSADDWKTWHRSLSTNNYLLLNSSYSGWSSASVYSSEINSTSFTVQGGYSNTNNATHVAYLFAHDPDGVIQCGSYTGNGSTTGPTVSLGWEPQYLLIKNSSATGNWMIYDNARDTANPRTYTLKANTSDAEVTTGNDVDFNSTGFQIKATASDINTDTNVYIYMAIKKAS